MIVSKINELKTMVQTGIGEKSHYTKILSECDTLMQKFLKAQDYKNVPPKSLFHQTTDERLKQVLDKQAKIKENPEVSIQEVSQNILSVFDSFIKRYHIGFIRDAQITSSGCAEVEIPCSITNSLYSSKQESAKKTFEMQMDFLKKEGFVVEQTKFGTVLKNCPNNHKTLYSLLKSRGARMIEIKTRDDEIDTVSFRVKLADINNFKCEPLCFELEVGDTLNEDEKLSIIKCCDEIKSTINFLPVSGIKNTCCSVAEYNFSDICDIFNFDCETRRNVKERSKEEREKNIKIRKIEKSFGDIVKPEKIKEILEPLKEDISKKTLEKTGFTVNNLSISKYGTASISFSYTTSPLMYYNFEMKEEDVENNIKETFVNNNGSTEKETLYILDTYENKEKMEEILSKTVPTLRLTNFEVSKIDNAYCIKAFSGTIDTLLPVIEMNKQNDKAKETTVADDVLRDDEIFDFTTSSDEDRSK